MNDLDALRDALVEALNNRLAPEVDARLGADVSKLSPPQSKALVAMTHSNISGTTAIGDNNILVSIAVNNGNEATAQALREQSQKLRALFQIPQPPTDFTGREDELKALRAGIPQGGVAISGLAGMGGVGKTVLACKLARELSPDYPDAELYLDLRGVEAAPMSVADALRQLIFTFHPTAQLPDDIAQLCAIYQSLLRDKRAIVLLDNAKDAAQVAPLLPPACCAAIVTSRQYFVVSGLKPQRLEKLTPPEARALLLKIEPRIGEWADEMARVLCYLPLALRLAASALAERPNLPPERYLKRLAKAETRMGLTDATRAENEPRTLEAILQLSYDLLKASEKKLWRTLAVFPDSFDEQAAAAIWQISEDAANDALSDLCNFSMVDFDATNNRYALHDLLRDFAVVRLRENEIEDYAVHKLHSNHYLNMLVNVHELFVQGSEAVSHGLKLFDDERPNIEAGQAWSVSYASQDKEAALLVMHYPDAGPDVLSLRHSSLERISWLEHALAAARQLKERQMEGNTLGNIGVAYTHLGKIRLAVEFYEQHLIIAREIGDRRGEGCALNNLGIAYKDMGEMDCSIKFHEQASVVFCETGDEHGEGRCLCNLGNAYMLLGKPRRAIELHEQALVVSRKIGDRQGEGNTLGNLGNAYLSLGKPHRAIKFHRQALVVFREIGDQRGEGNELSGLGNAYKALGETDRAIEFHEQSLVISREIGDRRGEGNDLGNLGNAYLSLGKPHRAIKLYEHRLVIAREIGDRRGEGSARFNMSQALNKLGQRPQAIELATAALEIFEQIEHPNAEIVRRQLAKWSDE